MPGEFHGQRSLVGSSFWGHKESGMTEWHLLSLSPKHLLIHFLTSISGSHYLLIFWSSTPSPPASVSLPILHTWPVTMTHSPSFTPCHYPFPCFWPPLPPPDSKILLFSPSHPPSPRRPDKAFAKTARAPSLLWLEALAAPAMGPIKQELLALAFQGLLHTAPPPFPASFHTSPIQAPTRLLTAYPNGLRVWPDVFHSFCCFSWQALLHNFPFEKSPLLSRPVWNPTLLSKDQFPVDPSKNVLPSPLSPLNSPHASLMSLTHFPWRPGLSILPGRLQPSWWHRFGPIFHTP